MTPVEPFPIGGEWAVDDLHTLPDDGCRYELYDGVVVMSPAPVARHQRSVAALYRLLSAGCPAELETFFAPFRFQPTRRRSVQPDLLVARRTDIRNDECLRRPPVLVVEVLAPGTRALDLVFRREMYATSGVAHLWTFDPREREVVVYRYRDDDAAYVEVARAGGDECVSVDRPFPVSVRPAEIIKG